MTGVDFSPLIQLMLLGLALGAVPLAVWGLRTRGVPAAVRLRRLCLLTAFLTFDLVVFGAFTRLSDSGLGCPDWPGCYGEMSPIAAHADIAAEMAQRPHGPVTHTKAWVEMVHRYWASAVGFLILVQAGLALYWRSHLHRSVPWLAGASLVWVVIQGVFGAWTVTWGLFPAIVTAHLLGGLILLALLVSMAWALDRSTWWASAGQRWALRGALGLTVLQILLGGWVSTNYAVMSCPDFPTCHGQAWPPMDWAQGFEVWRELGVTAGGEALPASALTAIHMAHRLGALAVTSALLAVAFALRRGQARAALGLVVLTTVQVFTGISNVVLGWPLVAALVHSAGAAALLVLLLHLSLGASEGQKS
ncbi:COX15/CtaA family protein [Inhella gelatinilytica]|uniref:COX15/CtaA family protein n=1 Tax=Inhella gelatinilytica TaxID=2795030 RepID=A0A931IW48_9BURK|nr:COX15/CtaA family protein [Inhella gelatinilytica]MBH9553239.1 COX15/CtaA family protein [Inhella gelatinilytica]